MTVWFSSLRLRFAVWVPLPRKRHPPVDHRVGNSTVRIVESRVSECQVHVRRVANPNVLQVALAVAVEAVVVVGRGVRVEWQ